MNKLLLIALVLFFSCNKSPKCEKWSMEDRCVSTDPTVIGCNGRVSKFTNMVCDGDLELAHSGKDKLLNDDGRGVKLWRHYIQKVD